MPTYTGTVQATQTAAGVRTLTVKGSTPPKTLTGGEIPPWLWELCQGNAGASFSLVTDAGPPETVASATVG